jgi:pimeloyl-ACP methyl ester carboxylesterase
VRRSVLALALVVVLLASACRAGDDSATSSGAPAPSTVTATQFSATGFVPGPLSWEPCGDGLDCATLTVPIDHRRPHGPTTDLALARRPAREVDDRIGVLLVNPGGPGASGTAFIDDDVPVEGLDERFDVVAWDPRGVGASGDLGCSGGITAFRALDPSPEDRSEQAALDAAARTIASDCSGPGAPDRDLAAHLDTATAAEDLDVLRRALGEDQVSFLGYSYGSLIGLEYLRAYPGQVRAMVLDGVVDPADTLAGLLTEQTVTIDRLVTDGLTACGAAGACALDDPLAAYDELAARVETEPLPADDRTPVGPGSLAFAAIAATYEADGIPRLGAALAEGLEGDGTALARMADSYAVDDDAFATYVATLCVDGPHPDGADAAVTFADALAARSPRFGATIANEILPCALWGLAPARTPAPAPSEAAGPPMLLVGTTGDGATPYAVAERVAATLPGSVLLTHDGLGHTASTGDPCVADAVRRALLDRELPPPGAVCGG